MAYFLGIDGGGTKTACLIGDESHPLGSAIAGGCNVVRLGEDVARCNLHTAIQQACDKARITPAQVTGACIGAAGVSAAGVRQKLASILSELVPGRIQVVGDTEIALQAAFADGPGVIVIAGTGSIAFGRDKDGHTARVGGWGYAISDEGSGHWIGRELVRRALRVWDAHDAGDLPGTVERVWHAAGVDEIVRIANASPQPNYAALVPEIVRSADAGNADARGILEDAAVELAHLAEDVIARLWGEDARLVPLAISGSVFRRSQIVRDTFIRIMRDTAWVQSEVVDPVTGALALARGAAR